MNSLRRPSLALGVACLALAVPAACGSTTASIAAGTTGTGTGGGATSGHGGGHTGTGGLGPGECRTQADCMAGWFCGVQIYPPFCGPQCDPSLTGINCQANADCQDAGAGLICDKPCVCMHGGA
jgi:hypothetical protein